MSNSSMNSVRKISTKQLAMVGIMAAICCIIGPLSISVGAIPFSLSVISVCVTGYVLGARLAPLAILVYILIGAAGLPVFSKFEGGIAKIMGPTGGYIVGFIFFAAIVGFFAEKFESKMIYMQCIGLLLGLFACYLFGTVWFTITNTKGMDFMSALKVCVYPFVIVDIAKLVLSFIIGNTLRKTIKELAI